MGSSVSLDLGPVHIRGAIKARYARIVWRDGTLYVVHRRAGRIERQTAQTSEPVAPKQRNGYWTMLTDDDQKISATRKGCSG